MEKKEYKKPTVINFVDDMNGGVPGALWGAALMVGRALAKAMKGGIDITAGTDKPIKIQEKQ